MTYSMYRYLTVHSRTSSEGVIQSAEGQHPRAGQYTQLAQLRGLHPQPGQITHPRMFGDRRAQRLPQCRTTFRHRAAYGHEIDVQQCGHGGDGTAQRRPRTAQRRGRNLLTEVRGVDQLVQRGTGPAVLPSPAEQGGPARDRLETASAPARAALVETRDEQMADVPGISGAPHGDES